MWIVAWLAGIALAPQDSPPAGAVPPPPAGESASSAPGLGLEELLRLALAHDGRVLAAGAELDAYRARYAEAQRTWFPVIRFEALVGGPVSERRIDRDACGSIPADECLKVSPASERGNLDFGDLGVAFGGKIEAALPIYTFGKLDAARGAARAGVQAGEAGLRRTRQDIALEVRRAYYGWLLADSACEILEDGQNKLKEAEEKLQKMLDEGNEEVSDRDQFKLRYYASQVEVMAQQARQGRELAAAALRFLTGRDDLGTATPIRAEPLQAPPLPAESLQTWTQRALSQRPELLQLRAARDATEALVEVQRAAFFPDFFLAGFLKGSYSPVHDFIRNPLLQSSLTAYDGGVALGMQVTLDIPQKLARLDRARADLAKISAQLDQAEAALRLQIEQKLLDLRVGAENLAHLSRGERAAKAWMRANMMDYGVGITNTRDLLDSLAAYAKARMDREKAIHDQRLAHDALRSAVGDDLSHTP
jgi:outer membrane protein TolC